MIYFLFLIKFSFSIYIIWVSSKNFDIAASYISRNLPDGIKGPTINAVASSFPELIISSLFLFYYSDVVGFSAGYATIVGSAAFNITVIPVIASWIYFKNNSSNNISINKTVIIQDSLFNLLSILFLGFTFFIGIISLITCIVLMLIYVFYIYFVFKNRNQHQVSQNKDFDFFNESEIHQSTSLDIIQLRLFSIFKNKVDNSSSVIVLISSIFLIAVACHLLTVTCEDLSSILGVDLFFISFFIAAIASSIPDTFLSIYDARNNKIDDAFSNAFGSNIFDICIGLGLPLFIYILLNGNIVINQTSAFNPFLLIKSISLLFLLSICSSLIFYFGRFSKLKSVLIFIFYLVFIYFML